MSGCREVVGVLNIGNNSKGFPQRIGRNGLHADGPVAALAGPGRRDDFELDVSTERMPLECVTDPPPYLVNGRGGFFRRRIIVHGSALSAVERDPPRADFALNSSSRMVNGELKPFAGV